MAIKTFEEAKDPDSLNMDYKYDLSNYLPSGVVVASIISVISDDPLLVVESGLITDSGTSITVFLSGGTVNQWASITARFTTDGVTAQTDDRTFRLFISQR